MTKNNTPPADIWEQFLTVQSDWAYSKLVEENKKLRRENQKLKEQITKIEAFVSSVDPHRDNNWLPPIKRIFLASGDDDDGTDEHNLGITNNTITADVEQIKFPFTLERMSTFHVKIGDTTVVQMDPMDRWCCNVRSLKEEEIVEDVVEKNRCRVLEISKDDFGFLVVAFVVEFGSNFSDQEILDLCTDFKSSYLHPLDQLFSWRNGRLHGLTMRILYISRSVLIFPCEFPPLLDDDANDDSSNDADDVLVEEEDTTKTGDDNNDNNGDNNDINNGDDEDDDDSNDKDGISNDGDDIGDDDSNDDADDYAGGEMPSKSSSSSSTNSDTSPSMFDSNAPSKRRRT